MALPSLDQQADYTHCRLTVCRHAEFRFAANLSDSLAAGRRQPVKTRRVGPPRLLGGGPLLSITGTRCLRSGYWQQSYCPRYSLQHRIESRIITFTAGSLILAITRSLNRSGAFTWKG